MNSFSLWMSGSSKEESLSGTGMVYPTTFPPTHLFATIAVPSSVVSVTEPTTGRTESLDGNESMRLETEMPSSDGLSIVDATVIGTVPMKEETSEKLEVDHSPSVLSQATNIPSPSLITPPSQPSNAPTTTVPSLISQADDILTSTPYPNTYNGNVMRAQASNTSITSLGFDLNSYYKPYYSSPRVISKPVARWISGPEHFQDYMNSVFIPRQEANMKNEKKHIVYVKRGTTGIAGQMAGMCDVLLTAITNDRVFQCIPAGKFQSQTTRQASLPTSSISRSSTSPSPFHWREIQVFPPLS